MNRFLCFYLSNQSDRCVLDGVSPSAARNLLLTGEELQCWGLAGLKALLTS